MFLSIFFKATWLVQLVVGIGLFVCAFLLEYQVLLTFFSPKSLALMLAVTLECGKVSSIIWHYYLQHVAPCSYPVPIRTVSLLFRLGLMLLSFLCSMLCLSAHLDRPGLERARAEEIQAAEQRLTSRLAEAERLHLGRKASALAEHGKEKTAEEEQWNSRIQKLEALMLAEMDNVVNGSFRGNRYQALEQRLAQEKEGRLQALQAGAERHARQLAELEDAFRTERSKLAQDGEHERQTIMNQDYATDRRANNPHVMAFLQMVESLLHRTLLPMQFVFVFSVLISALLEAGIMLAFSTITIAAAPVFMIHHEEALEKESLRARVSGEAEREDLMHGADLSRIQKAGEHVVKKARSLLNIRRRSNPATLRDEQADLDAVS